MNIMIIVPDYWTGQKGTVGLPKNTAGDRREPRGTEEDRGGPKQYTSSRSNNSSNNSSN